MRLRSLLIVLVAALAAAAPASAARTPRIVGGVTASQAYPAQAEVDISLGPIQELCGGTLVDPQWVLTAGHCVTSDTLLGAQLPAAAFTVRLGSANLDQGTPYAVDAVARADGFDATTLQDDAALLHLSTPAPEAPMALLDDATLGAALPGITARVIGWGTTTEKGEVSDVLREVDIPIATDDACRQAYGSALDTATMLCAGLREGGKDACSGDSGGPLMVATGSGLVLAGIVSFGNGCAEPNAYGVYTRLADAGLRAWIAGLVPTVAAAQSAGTADAARRATLAGATCGRRACSVQIAFATTGTAHASVRLSAARAAALGLKDRTVATRTEGVAGTQRLRLEIPAATRHKLARGRAREIPAVMTVTTVTAAGAGAVQRFGVRVRGSR